MVQLLLSRNALANAKDRYHATPLCAAAVSNGHEELVRVLISLAQTATDPEDGLGRILLIVGDKMRACYDD
jgi:ankyrin repeat protein